MNSHFNISVIIPTFNRRSTLKRAITSVLNQTFKPVEIIVVDDAGFLNIYNMDLTLYQSMPIKYDFSFFRSPLISDIDQDSDLEILVGTVNSLFIADIKQTANTTDSWNIFRENYKRNGLYVYQIGRAHV